MATARLADYFVVVGPDESLALSRPPQLPPPIVDIVVVLAAAGEKPPRGYHALQPGVVCMFCLLSVSAFF